MKLTKIHPITYTLYYIVLMLFTLLYNNPHYIMTFLICMIILVFFQGIKNELKNTLQIFIPMALMIIILNPLISKRGTSKIFLIGNQFITLESVIYGILMSLSFLIILLIFLSLNKSISYQDMLYISSRKFPNISILIIMTFRFITLISHRLTETRHILKFENNNTPNHNKINKIKDNMRKISMVSSWSLQESIITAKSMKARGYGITNRTSYLSYEFQKIDKIFLLIILITVIICISGLLRGEGIINIYPELSFSFHENPFNINYISFLILLMPLIYLEIRERLLWQ